MTSLDTRQRFPRGRRSIGRRVLVALLAVPLLFGALAVPAIAPGPVAGDELSDAQAARRALEKRIREQKALIESINSSQASLSGEIAQTQGELDGITNDLTATRKRVNRLNGEIKAAQTSYDELVAQVADLDAQIADIAAQEEAKKKELRVRKAQLAERIRQAWEDERTSLLETLLSGASFADMLAAMSAQLDAAEQDRALAQQIALDRETLLELHQTLDATRADTELIRQQTEITRQRLDRKMADLKVQTAQLRKLEKAAKDTLAAQKAAYTKLASDKAKLRKAVAAANAARAKLQNKIDRIIAEQVGHGNIPSEYNGSLIWPMAGAVTQDFGCTGFSWEPPSGSCAHWHNGIDLVADYGTPVKASGAGRVVYCGWNYADGADPAWIVIIAHASNLVTWYAHLTPSCPAGAGTTVAKGQVIGYEGNTGHSTGAHLHWMVWFNGSFVNPRLFV